MTDRKRLSKRTDRERLRSLAVEKHDLAAGEFMEEYRILDEHGYFATAFLLGRKKIDEILFAELSSCRPDARVLDIGCGTGSQIYRIRQAGFETIGLEPAVKMRDLAIQLNPGVKVLDGSVTRLPFEDNSFDFILALEVLRYLPRVDVETAYAEMLRVLSPGGVLVFTMVNRWAIDGYFLYEKVRSALGKRGLGPVRAHCEFVTPRLVRTDLRSLGFTAVETFGRLLLPLRWVYKVNRPLGRRLAQILDPADEFLCRFPFASPFAGHLIVIARI